MDSFQYVITCSNYSIQTKHHYVVVLQFKDMSREIPLFPVVLILSQFSLCY
jgi:hypothetical protein